MKKRVVVLGMGGTIAGRAVSVADNLAYKAGQLNVESLLELIPSERFAEFQIESCQVAQLDSKDTSLAVLLLLSQKVSALLSKEDVVGIVVTHGTDTLEEAAFFLQEVCNPTKPVVLTCAMRPATSFAPDGPQNLLDSIAVVCCPEAGGVLVVCAGKIHVAARVQKNHTYRLDAFSSGEAGCHGFVEEGRARFMGSDRPVAVGIGNLAVKRLALSATEIAWPRVEILTNCVGASGLIVDALLAQGVDGIVVAGTGNGTIHYLLEDALLNAQALGVAIVVSTRCAEGRVLPFEGRPFLDSKGLSPVKARILLILDLLGR